MRRKCSSPAPWIPHTRKRRVKRCLELTLKKNGSKAKELVRPAEMKRICGSIFNRQVPLLCHGNSHRPFHAGLCHRPDRGLDRPHHRRAFRGCCNQADTLSTGVQIHRGLLRPRRVCLHPHPPASNSDTFPHRCFDLTMSIIWW